MAEKLKVSEKLKSTVRNLSGGERQRIAIIRSMICDQKIILADEPTGSLDKENSEVVMSCLRELVSDLDKAVVIVTHDLNVARQCDRAFNLAGGVLTPSKLSGTDTADAAPCGCDCKNIGAVQGDTCVKKGDAACRTLAASPLIISISIWLYLAERILSIEL